MSRSPKQIDSILTKIGLVWKKHPDLRLCQLLSNASSPLVGPDLFYIEDQNLLIDLYTYHRLMNQR